MKCEKVKILKDNKILKKDNIIIIEIIKYFIVKKFSYYPKIRVNSLKSSTIYACFYGFLKIRMVCTYYEIENNENYENMRN